MPRTKKTLGKKRVRRGKRSAKPSAAFAKRVQAVVSKNVETKTQSHNFAITNFNSPVNNVADVCRVIPLITQGVDQGDRIGDQIRGQKLVFRGHFMINAIPNATGTTIPTGIPTNSRFMVRAFICSVKRFGNYEDAAATTSWMSQFLKNGNTNQGLDGTVQSMYLPVNTESITVHKEWRQVVTIPAIIAQTATATGFSNVTVPLGNTVRLLSASIKCKKLLKYDTVGFSPQNFAPFFVLSYCHLDDSSPDIITAKISAAYSTTLFYEDA